MGILSFAAAVAVGVAGTKVYERVKEKNPDGKLSVDAYIEETKEFVGEVAEDAKEKIGEVINKK